MTTETTTVPVKLPDNVYKDFFITHSSGESQALAWSTLLGVISVKGRLRHQDSVAVVKDVHGEPALVFPGTPKTQFSVLFSHLATVVERNAPALAVVLRRAVKDWHKPLAVPAEEKLEPLSLKPSVDGGDALAFTRFVTNNVNNSNLADADFRKMVRNSLKDMVVDPKDYAKDDEEDA